jgi:putative DNA primase/helicase
VTTPIFHPAHLADLKRSGLSEETIQAAGIYTVPPDEIGKKLGGLANGVVSAFAFPYPGFDGYERYKAWREETADPKAPKYLQKTGTPNHLYFPPGVDLADDSPLIFTEGEKKALALRQAGFLVVGIGGIWNWYEKGEGYKKPKESRPIADLDRVNWRRTVTIIFDSDGHDNYLVRLAAFRLARELSHRGAAVSILFLPHGKNGEKVGVDDFLVAHGQEKLREMLP